MKAPISFGVGVGLIARVDDRARGRGGARDLLADVLRALRQAVVEAARGLQHLARAREYLTRDEERDESFRKPLERYVSAHQVILVTTVRVTCRVCIVLEEQDVARDAIFAQALLRLVQEVLDDALARLVVDHQLGDVIALRRRVFGMESRVQVEPGPVFEEDIGVPRARDHLLEQIPRDVVGRQAPLAIEGAGQAVLVLEAEDAALHLGLSLARPTSVCPAVGSAPRAGCAGTCAAPSSGPARPPRDRAR